jgi:hypothetical protein
MCFGSVTSKSQWPSPSAYILFAIRASATKPAMDGKDTFLGGRQEKKQGELQHWTKGSHSVVSNVRRVVRFTMAEATEV